MSYLAQVLLIASLYWGATPVCGLPAINDAALPGYVVGAAYWSECLIEVDRRKLREAGEACMTVTHEYGHLLGIPEDGGVMAHVLGDPIWPCRW